MPSLDFAVRALVDASHFVGVVGNYPQIGEWQLQNALEMNKDPNSDTWRCQVEFAHPGELEYRYFIGRKVKTTEGKEYIIVKKWESGPRRSARKSSILNGVTSHLDVADFGIINDKNVHDVGWLSGQTEVRFTFSQTGEAPMVAWQAPDLPNINSLSLSFMSSGSVIDSQVRKIEPYNWSQHDAVEKLPFPEEDSVLTYIVQVADLPSFAGRFILCQENSKELGYAMISSSQLEQSTSYIKLAIADKSLDVIGTLHMEIVIIKSYEDQSLLDMQKGFGNHWKKRSTPLQIGHRGCGNSFTAAIPSDIYENTLESFVTASKHQADLVEFDVQLTKDKIPIIFHDFTICTNVTSKQGPKQALHEVEVQSLTYDELMQYKLRHRARKTVAKQPKFDEDSYDNQKKPFLTLQEIMEKVPEHTGFDIELKWPEYNLDKSYSHGVEKFCDANEFVDIILDVVLKYRQNRRIIFSTFDINICTFVQRKQNQFPVIYLMDEGSIFMDLRSRHNKLAVPFAASENFIGICFSEDSAFSDDNFIASVHEKNLRCLFYGDHIGEEENRRKLSERGVDGIIYDRIHQVLPVGLNVFQQKNP